MRKRKEVLSRVTLQYSLIWTLGRTSYFLDHQDAESRCLWPYWDSPNKGQDNRPSEKTLLKKYIYAFSAWLSAAQDCPFAALENIFYFFVATLWVTNWILIEQSPQLRGVSSLNARKELEPQWVTLRQECAFPEGTAIWEMKEMVDLEQLKGTYREAFLRLCSLPTSSISNLPEKDVSLTAPEKISLTD